MEGFFKTAVLFLIYAGAIFLVLLPVYGLVNLAIKNRRKANIQKQKSREPIKNMYFLLYGKDGIVEPVYEAVIDYTVDRNGRIKRTGDEIRQMQKEVRG
jgi:hypothetical protein